MSAASASGSGPKESPFEVSLHVAIRPALRRRLLRHARRLVRGQRAGPGPELHALLSSWSAHRLADRVARLFLFNWPFNGRCDRGGVRHRFLLTSLKPLVCLMCCVQIESQVLWKRRRCRGGCGSLERGRRGRPGAHPGPERTARIAGDHGAEVEKGHPGLRPKVREEIPQGRGDEHGSHLRLLHARHLRLILHRIRDLEIQRGEFSR